MAGPSSANLVLAAWGVDLIRHLEKEAAAKSPFQLPAALAAAQASIPLAARAAASACFKPVLVDPGQIAFLREFGRLRREKGPGRFLIVSASGAQSAMRYKPYSELKLLSPLFEPEGAGEQDLFSHLIEQRIDPDGMWVVTQHPRVDAAGTRALLVSASQGPGRLQMYRLPNGTALFTGSVCGVCASWMLQSASHLQVRPFAEAAIAAWWSCLGPDARENVSVRPGACVAATLA
jgi:hypothetical protein